jgi:tRNA(Ile)-lysidine synthase
LDLLAQVQRTIANWQMLEKGDRLLVAVSGGPDSVALLHLLWRLGRELNLSLYVVHLNHQLRGSAADGDQEYVRQLASSLSLPFFTENVDVASLAKQRRLTVEEAGRLARYRLFSRVAHQVQAGKVALGHNADDQAETVLMRLIRGAGARGLGGMAPVGQHSGLVVVRPILECYRAQIEAYCLWAKLEPRCDATNREPIYFRNRIRSRYLPLLEEENPSLRQNLAQTAQILRAEDDYLDQVAEKLSCHWQEGEVPRADLLCHRALSRRAVRLAVSRWFGEVWSFEHIEAVIGLAQRGEGRLSLPGGREAKLEGELITIGCPHPWRFPDYHYLLPCPGSVWIPEWDLKLSIRRTYDFEPGPGREYFLEKELQFPLMVRTRKPGDRFRPRGVPGTKKLQDWFVDAKLPRRFRDTFPLLVDGEGILWVVGRRRSSRALPKEGERLVVIEIRQDMFI